MNSVTRAVSSLLAALEAAVSVFIFGPGRGLVSHHEDDADYFHINTKVVLMLFDNLLHQLRSEESEGVGDHRYQNSLAGI